ncbi:DUF488 domain-containing protein [Nitrospina watsonii]|uniref:DUF488 domain-containing protein n=1 Tax=Nitrospina watsonii TaxID=1323948 RepID=UPI0024904080|nr:DUF488 domain-containing protein [Nitrospina watsonii]
MPSKNSKPIRLYTIGFTKKSAEVFFARLKKAGVKKIIDVRLNNESQIAGFAKKQDLPFFLKKIGGIDYEHRPDLAPTQALIDEYRKEKKGVENFKKKYLKLVKQRKVEKALDPKDLDGACFLCSEDKAPDCHRHFLTQYLSQSCPTPIEVEDL